MPAAINRRALKRAWVIKWKKAKPGSLIEIVEIITPSWLRVDRAIIFFRSHSARADIPAISMVTEAIKRSVGQNRGKELRNG